VPLPQYWLRIGTAEGQVERWRHRTCSHGNGSWGNDGCATLSAGTLLPRPARANAGTPNDSRVAQSWRRRVRQLENEHSVPQRRLERGLRRRRSRGLHDQLRRRRTGLAAGEVEALRVGRRQDEVEIAVATDERCDVD
jgi:hypothetical protein